MYKIKHNKLYRIEIKKKRKKSYYTIYFISVERKWVRVKRASKEKKYIHPTTPCVCVCVCVYHWKKNNILRIDPSSRRRYRKKFGGDGGGEGERKTKKKA